MSEDGKQLIVFSKEQRKLKKTYWILLMIAVLTESMSYRAGSQAIHYLEFRFGMINGFAVFGALFIIFQLCVMSLIEYRNAMKSIVSESKLERYYYRRILNVEFVLPILSMILFIIVTSS